ncbi:MAG: hypothetical protein ACJ8DC_08290 [Gemmatimonadales bacterium]
MAKNYRACPACGQRALSIATRCPRCGHEFPSRPIRWQKTQERRPLPPVLAVAAVLLAVGGLATLLTRGGGQRDRDVTASAAGSPAVRPEAEAEAPAAPDSAPTPEAVPRRARTWTKVHDRRSVKADVVAVLLPGDTVLADSLRGGWWRVALEGRVIGYVYGRALVGE